MCCQRQSKLKSLLMRTSWSISVVKINPGIKYVALILGFGSMPRKQYFIQGLHCFKFGFCFSNISFACHQSVHCLRKNICGRKGCALCVLAKQNAPCGAFFFTTWKETWFILRFSDSGAPCANCSMIFPGLHEIHPDSIFENCCRVQQISRYL